MFYLSDETLDRYIQEDIPYFDLTTWVLGMGDMPGNMEYFTREDAVLCGTEEVVRILQKMQIQVDMGLGFWQRNQSRGCISAGQGAGKTIAYGLESWSKYF